MKKFLCLLSLCFMTVGFVGCGEAEETTDAPETPAVETEGEADGSETKTDDE